MGRILKSAEVTKDDLQKINKYTRRNFKEDEVYTFSLVLCDNDIDRDYERFTVEALFELEKMFLGKTGIFDHNPKAENQSARIYECKVEAVNGKKTAYGDDYFRLTAKAYIPVSKNTENLILSIDSGILKEVSIGCSVGEKLCSVCGKEQGECHHIKGKKYGNDLCCYLLNNPTDAYEWSFVAVPAQKQAGVIKALKNYKEKIMEKNNSNKILKAMNENSQKAFELLEKSEGVFFDGDNCTELSDMLKRLEKEAEWGREYKEDLCRSFLRLSAIVQPEVSKETALSLTEKLNIPQLKEFICAYEKKAENFLPVRPQLYAAKRDKTDKQNKAFEI